MTLFEIIVISFIYLFCYGYTLIMLLKEKDNVWLVVLFALISFALAIYAPIYIGGAVFKKLNN